MYDLLHCIGFQQRILSDANVEELKKYIAFSTETGHYKFKRMPLGFF